MGSPVGKDGMKQWRCGADWGQEELFQKWQNHWLEKTHPKPCIETQKRTGNHLACPYPDRVEGLE